MESCLIKREIASDEDEWGR